MRSSFRGAEKHFVFFDPGRIEQKTATIGFGNRNDFATIDPAHDRRNGLIAFSRQ